jgi:hypothetical protein
MLRRRPPPHRSRTSRRSWTPNLVGTVLPRLVLPGVVALMVLACSDTTATTGTTIAGSVSSGTGVPATVAPATSLAESTTTEPPPPLVDAFAAIADRAALTDEAKDLLARSSPQLVDQSVLASTCTLDPALSVLGCYRAGEITVLEITDPRLGGMTETTAAHEVLHAAWVVLDDDERDQLAVLLHEDYDRIADADLTARIDAYRDRDPSSVANELHSILGTEVADLGSELEEYYQRWFTDRRVVVELAAGARQTFTDLQGQVADLDDQLVELRTQIETGEQALAADRAVIESEAAVLDGLRAEGRIEEYNAGVDPFNQQVQAYNEAVIAHQELVDRHNDLVTERNDLAAAYTDLVDQVTTTVESVPE